MLCGIQATDVTLQTGLCMHVAVMTHKNELGGVGKSVQHASVELAVALVCC